MKTQIYLVDENGFFIESIMVNEVKPTDIITPIYKGYVRTKWNGTDWEEGATAEEITAFESQQLAEQAPSLEDIVSEQQIKITELETKVIELQNILEV